MSKLVQILEKKLEGVSKWNWLGSIWRPEHMASRVLSKKKFKI